MSIYVENLYYRHTQHGHNVLRDINFNVTEGELTAVLGPNGSGKTTLLRCIASLCNNQHLSGAIRLLNNTTEELLHQYNELAKIVSYVPGTLDTPFAISVNDFVLQSRFAHQSFFGGPSAHDQKAAAHALDSIGLTAMARVPISELSSGEKQLALLARGLAQETKILLVDETIANLDLHFQLTVMRALKKLAKAGTTILIVSHDINLMSEFCPQALWLKNGELVNSGELNTALNKELLAQLYPDRELGLGQNPFTGATKIFFNPKNKAIE